MGTVYKVLGQSTPSANVSTTLYTVPSDVPTSTIVSTLAVCNKFTTTTYQVAIVPNGQTLSSNNYIVYNSYINNNDTVFLTLGMTISSGDQLVVLATTGNITFSAFGSEIS